MPSTYVEMYTEDQSVFINHSEGGLVIRNLEAKLRAEELVRGSEAGLLDNQTNISPTYAVDYQYLSGR